MFDGVSPAMLAYYPELNLSPDELYYLRIFVCVGFLIMLMILGALHKQDVQVDSF